MLDLAVNSRIARDLSAQQFAAGARRSPRIEEPETIAPRAPVRRSAVARASFRRHEARDRRSWR